MNYQMLLDKFEEEDKKKYISRRRESIFSVYIM